MYRDRMIDYVDARPADNLPPGLGDNDAGLIRIDISGQSRLNLAGRRRIAELRGERREGRAVLQSGAANDEIFHVCLR